MKFGKKKKKKYQHRDSWKPEIFKDPISSTFLIVLFQPSSDVKLKKNKTNYQLFLYNNAPADRQAQSCISPT